MRARLLRLLLRAAALAAPAAQQPDGEIASQMGGQWKDVPYKVHSQLHDDCLEGNVTAVRPTAARACVSCVCVSCSAFRVCVCHARKRRARRRPSSRRACPCWQVKEALEAGSMYINEQRGSAFNTPLHNTATTDNLEVARLLVEVGAAPIQETTADGTLNVRLGYEVANIDARNEIHATPLMFAAGSNQTRMMLYLLERGADVLLETESGGTAMQFAVRSNNSELVAAFLEFVAANASAAAAAAAEEDGSSTGLDALGIVNHANKQGWSPMHFAARQNSVGIAALLLEHGADVNPVESRGYNPLLVAAALQQHAVAAFLLRSGADASNKDDGQLGGKTVLEHLPSLREELR